jgi:hypothetical protein
MRLQPARERLGSRPSKTPPKKASVPEDTDDETAPEDLEDIDEDSLDALGEGDEDLEDLEDADLEDEDLEDDVLADEGDDDDATVVVDGVEVAKEGAAAKEGAPEDGDDDEDEEPDDEDVEASLDVILKERLVVEDEVEDDEVGDVDDRSEASERVLPKQPDEFVCRSCFLVKHSSQLANKKRGLCRDCV